MIIKTGTCSNRNLLDTHVENHSQIFVKPMPLCHEILQGATKNPANLENYSFVCFMFVINFTFKLNKLNFDILYSNRIQFKGVHRKLANLTKRKYFIGSECRILQV